MAFEHRPGTFSLFKNDKGDVEARPDYRGEGRDLNGDAIEVAAWLKDGKKAKYMSCTFKLATVKKTVLPTIVKKTVLQPAPDDELDIPF